MPAITVNQLRSLQPGESLSISKRVPIADVTSEDARETIERMRNLLGSMANREKTPQAKYTVDTGKFITNDMTAFIITAVITRV